MTLEVGEAGDVEAFVRAYEDAWASGRPERVVALRTPDHVVVNRFGQWWTPAPREEVESDVGGVMLAVCAGRTLPGLDVRLVQRPRGDVAIVTATAVHEGVVLPDGRALAPFEEVVTYVLVHDGHWRVASENIQNVWDEHGTPDGPTTRATSAPSQEEKL